MFIKVSDSLPYENSHTQNTYHHHHQLTNPFSFSGFVHLGAGLSVGLSGLAAGFAIGIVGDAGVRGTAQQPRLFVGMILILIFAEVRQGGRWMESG